MTKLCEELEHKFLNIEGTIEAKIKIVNETYRDEIELLNEKFNLKNLSDKYSNEFNMYRDGLLKQSSSYMLSEINHANEMLAKKDTNFSVGIKFKNVKNLEFKRSILKSTEVCIWKIINIDISPN